MPNVLRAMTPVATAKKLMSTITMAERAAESLYLVVHRDAHRLKETRKIRWPRARAERSPNRAHQVVAGGERHCRPTPHDFARETSGPRFVAEILEDRRKLALVARIE